MQWPVYSCYMYLCEIVENNNLYKNWILLLITLLYPGKKLPALSNSLHPPINFPEVLQFHGSMSHKVTH